MTLVALANNKYEYDFGNGRKAKIGDTSDLTKFKPTIELQWWECLIKLGLQGITGNLSPVKSGDGLSVENIAIRLDWIPTTSKEDFNDSGGYDWKITLKKKPPVNSFTFSYDQTLATAVLQPPLTQEYTPGMKDWLGHTVGLVSDTDVYDNVGKPISHRPEHVVNSICFFHATRGNVHATQADAVKYKTSKIGCLYRMRATDAVGKTEWLNWSLGAGTITGSLPQNYIDTAVYPVVIAPIGDTFGWTSNGGSTDWFPGERLYGMRVTGAAGTATNITAYIRSNETSPDVDRNWKAVLVLQSDYSIVTGGTSAATITDNTISWDAATINSTISAVDYYICFIFEGSGDFVVGRDTATTNTRIVDGTNSYATPSAPAGTDVVTSSYRFDVYCTYTPDAGGTTVTPGVLTMTMTTYAPVNKFGIIPGVLAQTLTSYAPVLKETTTPGVLSLTTTSYAPSINVGTLVIPTTLALTMAFFAPTLAMKIIVPLLALVITAYAPTIITLLGAMVHRIMTLRMIRGH